MTAAIRIESFRGVCSLFHTFECSLVVRVSLFESERKKKTFRLATKRHFTLWEISLMIFTFSAWLIRIRLELNFLPLDMSMNRFHYQSAFTWILIDFVNENNVVPLLFTFVWRCELSEAWRIQSVAQYYSKYW